MSFLTMYSLTVLATIDASIALASRPFEPDELLYQVSFEDGKDGATYRILAGNSLWLFLQDEKLQVEMVPIEQIRSVRKLPGTVEHP